MRHIAPKKLQVIMLMFFGTGIWGIVMGLSQNFFYLTSLGVINICLGGLAGWIYFTQKPHSRDKRKK